MKTITILFNKIRTLTLWQRLFSWSSIKALAYDAALELKLLEADLDNQKTRLESSARKRQLLENDLRYANEKALEDRQTLLKLESTVERLQAKISDMGQVISDLRIKVSTYENNADKSKKDLDRALERMMQAQQNFEKDSRRLHDEKIAEKETRFALMKRQWAEHEAAVQQAIRGLCEKHIIPYIDKVPFKGKPDNTIEICGEYVIFDAKSPATDNYDNFATYIKNQAGQLEKYTRQEKVKKDIFLVIPSSTVEIIPQWSYNMGDYQVFIITKEALEPVILSLKKIEDYEFADQMSPEERENITRIIGKFAHTAKRRIQVDQFFANHFLDLLRKCEVNLPEDFIKQIREFEKAEKLNPPTEKRAKQILVKDLKEKHAQTNAEAGRRNLEIPQKFDDIKKWA